jgi:hypothetical protein
MPGAFSWLWSTACTAASTITAAAALAVVVTPCFLALGAAFSAALVLDQASVLLLGRKVEQMETRTKEEVRHGR